ncbi:hypothetical protein V3C99_005183, partial [Haemonchus contortus]|uniref:Cubilin n=1 Tax=Haemonchus contortus TaxID=6289 RepID=A0A7I5E5L2_HAECO
QDELQWAGLRLASYNDPPPPPPPPRNGAASFRQRWKMLHYPAALCILTSIPLVLASYPYCPCVPFNTTGRFHSPNYPANLENIDCLFYHFQAPLGSIVQITFRSFSLPVRNPICTSSLRIFDSSLDGLVDPEEEPSFTFCGHEIAPGATFYSRHEHLLLQIMHADASSKGFIGDYRFPSKDNYLNDGIEIADCSYRIEKTKGVLYSPSYPFYYQSFVNCTYILPQRKGHRIVLSSGEISLGREATIDIFETTNGHAKLLSVPSTQHSLYASSASSLLMHFQAGNNHDKGRGFVIEFTYEAAVWRSSEGVAGECLLTITSENEKTGTLSSTSLNSKSSNLPSKCQITFQGYPNEHVSVKFTHFNLYVPESKNLTRRCADVDHLTADVRVGARLSRIDEWCGDRTPPQLMSSTNLLQLEYTTKSSRALRESAKNDIGFRLDYKFHTDWNMQHMRARGDRDKGCRFIFNSSVQSSGKLWSVNYPGLYPRSLYCEYIFHGSEEQTVHIHFEYFDVEGFNQCDETTQSDFVLFSNYQTHDRTNRRFCGKVAPRGPILSESNYFRMIFATNDIFDATGFYAHYQFITQQKAQISRVKLTTSSPSSVHRMPLVFILIAFLLITLQYY